MADACFPMVRSLTSIESEAFIWVDVDFGGHADPQSALEAVRWYCREKGLKYEHFLRVHFCPRNTDNGIYTYAFRDASTARLWRDVLMDPNLDPPGLRIDRNGTPEPFTVPRNKKGQPSLRTLLAVLQEEDNDGPWIISNKSLEKISEEKINDLIQKRRDKTHAGTGGVPGSGGGGGGGGGASSSQTAITSSPTKHSAAAASAGSSPTASASSEAGMTPPAITPSSSLIHTPMFERQRLEQPARSARGGEVASSAQVRLNFDQPLKLQSAWNKAREMFPKVNDYLSSAARGGGAGVRGLTSGDAPSREPEGDRTDGSSAKKAKKTHHKATLDCAAHSDVSGGEETETVAGTGSSLQSQTLTLPCARTPEPDDPPSGSAPLPPGPTLADNAGQGAATDGALGHGSDSESEDEPGARWAKKYQARWMPSGCPQGGGAGESPTSATIHDQPTARSGKDSKRVMSVVERRKELHEGKR